MTCSATSFVTMELERTTKPQPTQRCSGLVAPADTLKRGPIDSPRQTTALGLNEEKSPSLVSCFKLSFSSRFNPPRQASGCQQGTRHDNAAKPNRYPRTDKAMRVRDHGTVKGFDPHDKLVPRSSYRKLSLRLKTMNSSDSRRSSGISGKIGNPRKSGRPTPEDGQPSGVIPAEATTSSALTT